MNVTEVLDKFGKGIFQLIYHFFSEDEHASDLEEDSEDRLIDSTIAWIEDHNEKSINYIIFEENR